jgi:serine/threonine-protein kinase HipA
MNNIVEVILWGEQIGAAAVSNNSRIVSFQYSPDFIRSGMEVAPLTMPLNDKVYTFPSLSADAFYGLPGLLADSLPDRFGNALIDAWLASQGRTPESFTALERLCYIGKRGMGALEFRPALGPTDRTSKNIHIDKLVNLASEILTQKETLNASFNEKRKTDALKEILLVGTSTGGARAKAVITWNSATNEVRSGQLDAPPGFSHWLLKFDGVSGNRDKELNDPKGYGAIEYAYYKMALDAGIMMSESRILEENGRHHFMTRRYDRTDNGRKLHKLSLYGMAHYDFHQPGAYSYEQVLFIIRRLGLPMSTVEQFFRRIVFNIVARNQDDHVKNIEFLMDKSGEWSLAPAFDLTYSYHPYGQWTSRHQMTLNNKQDNFTQDDFKACAETASMKRGQAAVIIREVTDIVSKWEHYADKAGVSPNQRNKIQKTLRLNLL